jgi:hypothetical protein
LKKLGDINTHAALILNIEVDHEMFLAKNVFEALDGPSVTMQCCPAPIESFYCICWGHGIALAIFNEHSERIDCIKWASKIVHSPRDSNTAGPGPGQIDSAFIGRNM